MKTLKLIAAALLLGASALQAAAPKALPTGKYELDLSHSKIGFEVTHLVVATVSGQFDKATATLDLNADASKSKVSAEIEVASINTGNPKREEHLRSADFFDAEKHPKITFVSKSFSLKGDKLTVSGDLTMRGTTKPVVLEGRYRGAVADGWGNEKVGASLRTTISRKEFGILWNKAIEAGPVVSDEVDLILNIEAGRPLAVDKK
jgi:polyisoprenoid-binding protein YceI